MGRLLLDPSKWEEAWLKMDTSFEGQVTFAEMYRFVNDVTENDTALLRKAFSLMDIDDSGSILKVELIRSVKENQRLQSFLQIHDRLRILLMPRRWQKAFEEMDTSGDGELSWDEFEIFCHSPAILDAPTPEIVSDKEVVDSIYSRADPWFEGYAWKEELVRCWTLQ